MTVKYEMYENDIFNYEIKWKQWPESKFYKFWLFGVDRLL